VFVTAPRRYRAPAADGGLLADPPLDEIDQLLDANSSHAGDNAVAEVVAAACDYHRECGEPVPPIDASRGLLVAGHQPELFHPGVWVKNFALAGLARRHGLTPLNLVVDNDTAKSATLRLPATSTDPAHVHLAAVPFDHWAGEVPWEERRVIDEDLFTRMPRAAAEVTAHWGFTPMVPEAWAEVLRQRERTPLLGERLAAGRRAIERQWGCHNLELPVSRLCRTAAFDMFVATVIDQIDTLHEAYNGCLREYRRTHGIRSRNHPVPELARTEVGWELPFWGWKAGAPRRGRLFLRDLTSWPRLWCDGEEWPAIRGENWLRELDAAGYKVRPRALTLTLFARLWLADAFIHGIGGGLYDELTDAIIRVWQGTEPPRYLVLSATLRLPLPGFPADTAEVRRLEGAARDLHWNPQRHLPADVPTDALIRAARKQVLAGPPPGGAAARRAWFDELRAVTAALRPFVAPAARALEARLAHARDEVAANAVLRRRDYAWLLFPGDFLRAYLSSILHRTRS
jgi:hypothetical protein